MWLLILTLLFPSPCLPSKPHGLLCTVSRTYYFYMLSFPRQASLGIIFICPHHHPPLSSELCLLLVLVFPATGTILAHGRHSIKAWWTSGLAGMGAGCSPPLTKTGMPNLHLPWNDRSDESSRTSCPPSYHCPHPALQWLYFAQVSESRDLNRGRDEPAFKGSKTNDQEPVFGVSPGSGDQLRNSAPACSEAGAGMALSRFPWGRSGHHLGLLQLLGGWLTTHLHSARHTVSSL